MERSQYISKMGVGGVHHLIERAYREGSEMQFVRELYKNGIEAGATQIEFGPEWQGVERHGVYRLMVADNGKGMNAEQIETFLNTFGGGGKPIGDAHENYGIGAKTSTLPWNQKGVVVLSWTENDPIGVMLWLCKDPLTGEYGSRQFETKTGEYDTVVAPFNDKAFGINWGKIKPDWFGSSGTIVICLGNTGKEDTFMQKNIGESFALKGISLYLNKRIWEIPNNVQVFVQELRSKNKDNLPKSIIEAARSTLKLEGTDIRWNRRRVKGARYHLLFPGHKKGKMKAEGSITVSDGTKLNWYLWEGDRPNIHAIAHEKGYISALYDNELYDVKTHHSSFRSFGISASKVRENLTIIAKPPILNNYVGVYPDTARNTLKIMGTKKAGEPLPWAEWGEEFSNNLPSEIIEALKNAITSSSGTIEDNKWRHKLAERFGNRWKQKINKLSEDGMANISPNQTLNLFVSPGTTENEKPIAKGGLNAEKFKENKPHNAGIDTSGEEKAKETDLPRGIPNYRWVKEEDLEPGIAAAWEKPNSIEPYGIVLLNRDFEMFTEVVDYWQEQYPDHLGDKIEKVVQEVYGQAMVARIAHSESLARNKNWGRKGVDQDLRSTGALTMAVLGLITEDHIIANRLGAILSKRQNN